MREAPRWMMCGWSADAAAQPSSRSDAQPSTGTTALRLNRSADATVQPAPPTTGEVRRGRRASRPTAPPPPSSTWTSTEMLRSRPRPLLVAVPSEDVVCVESFALCVAAAVNMRLKLRMPKTSADSCCRAGRCAAAIDFVHMLILLTLPLLPLLPF